MFEIGQKVRYVGTNECLQEKIGVIVKIQDGTYGVCFEGWEGGHDCWGAVEDSKSCWWCGNDILIHVEDDNTKGDDEMIKRAELKQGTYVVCYGYADRMNGKVGKIVDESTSFGVEFEEYIGGHNCDGKAQNGHGQYIGAKHLSCFNTREEALVATNLTLGRRIKHNMYEWGVIQTTVISRTMLVAFDDGYARTVEVADIIEKELFVIEQYDLEAGMKVYTKENGWVTFIKMNDGKLACHKKGLTVGYSIGGMLTDNSGVYIEQKDVLKVDTTIDINALMAIHIQNKSLASLKEELNDITEKVATYKERLVNTLKKKSDIEVLIKNYEQTTYDFNKLKEQLLAVDKIVAVDFDIQKGMIIAETNPIIITATNGGTYMGGRYKIKFRLNDSKVMFENLDDENKRRSHWGSSCHHPHVSNRMNPCLGSASESIAILSSDKQYDVLFMMLIAFLEQANLDDCAGRHVLNWDKCDAEGNITHEGYVDRDETEFKYGDTPNEDGLDDEDRTMCCYCEEYHHEDDMVYIDGDWVCESCCDEHYTWCETCEAYTHNDDAVYIHSESRYICEGCADSNYRVCYECSAYVPKDDVYLSSDGYAFCQECYDDRFENCTECDEEFDREDDELVDGLCSHCRDNEQEQEEETIDEETGLACPICGEVKELNYINNDGLIVCENCYVE